MSQPKRLFITIGATAPFNTLICAALSHAFLQALSDAAYTELRVQHGDQGVHILGEADLSNIKQRYGITVTGFDFNKSGLEGELKELKNTNGAVVSHAGSGSVLDAMRFGLPLVVVPNEDLAGNHQVELAVELERLKYAVYGRINDLASSIPKVEKLRQAMRSWPPSTSGEEKYEKGLRGIMDEEMGWLTVE